MCVDAHVRKYLSHIDAMLPYAVVDKAADQLTNNTFAPLMLPDLRFRSASLAWLNG